jgi:hypothetical protein
MRLVVSLPTRGRPQKLIDTIGRNLACLSRPDTLLMVQVDVDDTATLEVVNQWHEVNKSIGANRLQFDIREREDTIAAKWNRALCEAADVYCCLGDDDPLIDPDSDERILEAASVFPDGIGMVYGHLCNLSFASVICFTRRMTDLLGYIQPEYFPYWFCDHWTDDIGRIIGRVAFADVRTQQCADASKSVGKTQELREPAWWATWFDANYMVRREHAHRIIHALNEPDWRKKLLLHHAPFIEGRSRMINASVRGNANALENWSGLSVKDDRYQRVKDKAIEALPGILATLPPQQAEVYRKYLTPLPKTIINLPGGLSDARRYVH